jgi:20S proteasome alpha/beta subunit
VLACDSRVTAGTGIVTDDCLKYVVAGSAVALVAGSDGALMDVIASAKNIDGLRMLATEYSDGRQLQWELLCYCRKSERLVWLDNTGMALPLGDYHATGSGGDYALGVLSSAPKPKDLAAAARLVRKACRVAIKHNAACGGKVRVLVVRGKRAPVEFS